MSPNPLLSAIIFSKCQTLQKHFPHDLMSCNIIFLKRITNVFQQMQCKTQSACFRPQEINFLTSEKWFSFLSFLRWFFVALVLYCSEGTKGKTIYEWKLYGLQQLYFPLPSGFSYPYKLDTREISNRIKMNKSFVDLQKK